MQGEYCEAIRCALRNGVASVSLPHGALPALERALKQNIGLVTSTKLAVREAAEAKPNTLSAKYGGGAFPHHTDYAFRPYPPRLIVLVNEGDQAYKTSTKVSRFSDLPRRVNELHAKSQWILVSKGVAHIVGGVTAIGRHLIRRWDTEFLEPENGAAWVCVRDFGKFIEGIETVHIWAPRIALFIDNWNCTHSRASGGDCEERRLLRLEAWHHAGMDN